MSLKTELSTRKARTNDLIIFQITIFPIISLHSKSNIKLHKISCSCLHVLVSALKNFDVLKSVKFFSLVLFEITLCSRVGVLRGFY